MSKKVKFLVLVMAVIMSLAAILVVTTAAEEKDITISYMSAYEPSSSTSDLDKTAYSNGKQTVKAGEKFTLPTTANMSYVGEEGYQLVWYTSDGRSYKAGETVSFTEDTKLFRAVLKEVYSVDELSVAMANNSHGALLMTDINAGNAYISVWDQNYAILDLNGYTLTVQKNGTIMGGQRSAKVVIGKGTFRCINPDNKVGSYAVFECKSHSYNGDRNKTIIGKDITIDAPNFYLCTDGDAAVATGYPWIRVYGTINVYYILGRWQTSNANPKIEFFEGCNVTMTAPRMVVDYKTPTDSTIYNTQGFEIRIYGGTFNLPAEAANESFWTVDNIANQNTLTSANKDVIKIEGGTFVLPDNAVPAIANYLTEDYVTTMGTTYDFVKNNRNESTFEVTYKGIRYAYKFTLKKDGTLTLVDNMGTGLAGTYYADYTKKSDSSGIETFTLYEDADKTKPVTTFDLKLGYNNTFVFATPQMKEDRALQNMVANGVTYQVVVTSKCGTNASHSFNSEDEATFEATCQHTAYANYVCSGCGFSAYFNWGDLADHAFAMTSHTEATATTLGEKVFTCSGCNDAKAYPYTIDPSSLEVTVVIRNDDDTFETKTVLASDIFDFSISGVEGAYIYTVSAIKKFETHNIRNIYSITLPAGIMYVKISTQNYEKYKNVEYGVVEFIIPDGATVSILNIGNLRRLKTIKVGQANVTFGGSCSYYNPSNERRSGPIETIDVSAPGSTIVFGEWAFSGRTTIKNLLLADNCSYTFEAGAFNDTALQELDLSKNSTYVIKNESFKSCDFTELIIPDNATNITISGSPFKSCLTTYLYIGKNFTLNSALGYEMKYLEKIVIMDGVTFGAYFENLFYKAGSSDYTTPLYVYNHSTGFFSSGSIPKNTFNDCDGVFFYTVADGIGTRTDVFGNCGDVKDADGNLLYKAWTVYLGIPHSYENMLDPTCTDKGDIDCPCGVYTWNVHDGKWGYATFVEDAEKPGTGTITVAYKKYESVHKITTSTTVVEDTTLEGAQKTCVILPALGHNLLSVITEPLCLVDGEENLVCQREDCTHVEFVRVIDQKGHTMIYTMAYPNGFAAVGVRTDRCKDCEDASSESEAKAIFTALGYSVGPNGMALCAGFMVDVDTLEAYIAINPSFAYGMILVNANSITSTDSLFVEGDLNSAAKGLKIDVAGIKNYSIWNVDISGFNAEIATKLELVLGVYVFDENGEVSLIQHLDADKYPTVKDYTDVSVSAVTFNEVRVEHGLEALIPVASEDEE